MHGRIDPQTAQVIIGDRIRCSRATPPTRSAEPERAGSESGAPRADARLCLFLTVSGDSAITLRARFLVAAEVAVFLSPRGVEAPDAAGGSVMSVHTRQRQK